MGRTPRVDLEGHWYHVVARGNERRKVFLDGQDYRTYLSLLDQTLLLHRSSVGIFSLMPNHIHLVLRRGRIPLMKTMHRLQSVYSHYFNQRRRRVGHLFQGRYHAFLVDHDAYIQALMVYVHNNARRAELVAKDEPYRWSSERYYLGLENHPALKSFLPMPGFKEAAGFLAFQRLRADEKANKVFSRARLSPLESSGKEISLEIERRKAGRSARARRERRGLESVISILNRVAEEHGIAVNMLTSNRRDRRSSSVRRVAVKEMLAAGHGVNAISRAFNRSPSYISHIQETQEIQE